MKRLVVDDIVSYVGSSKGDYALYCSIKRVYNHFDDTERIDCLKQSQRSLIRISEDHIIDNLLPKFVRLFSSLSNEYTDVDKLLERYVAFNMNNYEQLDTEKRTNERFRVIFEACTYLKDYSLLKKILGDSVFWQKEWGLPDGENAKDGMCNTDEKYQVIQTSVKHSNRKIELYLLISNIKKLLLDSLIINNKLQHLITIINTNLSSGEARELYEEQGEVLHLFKTKDIEFIEKEFNEKSIDLVNAPYVNLNRISEILHSLVNKKALLLYYLHVAPQYPITSIDTTVFIDDIKTYPSILDEIIKNEYCISNQVSLTAWLKLLPEEYWTDAYKAFLKEQFELLFNKEYVIEPCVLRKEGGTYYISLGDNGINNVGINKWKKNYYNEDYSQCPVCIVTEMKLVHLNKSLADIFRKDKNSIMIWESSLSEFNVLESDFTDTEWNMVLEHDSKAKINSLIDYNGELYQKTMRKRYLCVKCNHSIENKTYIYPKNPIKFYKKIPNYKNYFTEKELRELFP
jgi:hypothetical protein